MKKRICYKGLTGDEWHFVAIANVLLFILLFSIGILTLKVHAFAYSMFVFGLANAVFAVWNEQDANSAYIKEHHAKRLRFLAEEYRH